MSKGTRGRRPPVAAKRHGSPRQVGEWVVLQMARDLLAENGWTQGHEARTADGQPCGYRDADAKSYSLGGALKLAAFQLNAAMVIADRARVMMKRYLRASLREWNDHPRRTYAEVDEALRETIWQAKRAREAWGA